MQFPYVATRSAADNQTVAGGAVIQFNFIFWLQVVSVGKYTMMCP